MQRKKHCAIEIVQLGLYNVQFIFIIVNMFTYRVEVCNDESMR